MHTLLAIGAADSSGQAGIALWSRTAGRAGVEVLPVAACVVARGREGMIQGLHALAPSVIARQIDSACEGGVDACLVGMLARHQNVSRVAERIARRAVPPVVLAPGVADQDGRQIMTSQGLKRTTRMLLPLCAVVVAGLPDAARLAYGWDGAAASGEQGRRPAALWAALHERGAACAVLCGAAGDDGLAPVMLFRDGAATEEAGRVPARWNMAEAVASATACGLARGMQTEEAVRAAVADAAGAAVG